MNRASEMSWSGGASSCRMVNRGLSQRFLESGASNLSTRASKLPRSRQVIRKQEERWKERRNTLTCGGCTAQQRLCCCSTLSSHHWRSGSRPAGERPHCRASAGLDYCRQNIEINESVKNLGKAVKVTRQCGVRTCFTRQNSSYR